MLGMIIGAIAGSFYDIDHTAPDNFDLFADIRAGHLVPLALSTYDVPLVAAEVKTVLNFPSESGAVAAVYQKLLDGIPSDPADWRSSARPVILNYRAKLIGGRSHANYSFCKYIGPAYAGWLYNSPSQTRRAARIAGRLYANYNEHIVVAEALASAIYLARIGTNKTQICKYITKEYKWSLPELQDDKYFIDSKLSYTHDIFMQALAVFMDAEGFEEAIRLSEARGGTNGIRTAAVGALAEAYYGIPQEIEAKCNALLEDSAKEAVACFDAMRKPRIERTT